MWEMNQTLTSVGRDHSTYRPWWESLVEPTRISLNLFPFACPFHRTFAALSTSQLLHQAGWSRGQGGEPCWARTRFLIHVGGSGGRFLTIISLVANLWATLNFMATAHWGGCDDTSTARCIAKANCTEGSSSFGTFGASKWSKWNDWPSLKLTFSPLKMDGWNTSFLWGWPIFRGELLV